MRFLRKVFRFLIAIILIILVSFIIIKVFLGEPKPTGEAGVRAERLADRMLQALNYDAYQEIEEIRWTFARGNHHYIWRKKVDSVQVSWDDQKVLMNTKTLEGSAFLSGKELTGSAAKELIETAWKYFANDSFWLVAPFKVRDQGTELELVTTDIGHGLMVTYTIGGVTPGDSYLWILDSQDRPVAWQMWVSIIPIGGLELTWEGWEEHKGAWFATQHESAIPISVDIVGLEVK